MYCPNCKKQGITKMVKHEGKWVHECEHCQSIILPLNYSEIHKEERIKRHTKVKNDQEETEKSKAFHHEGPSTNFGN